MRTSATTFAFKLASAKNDKSGPRIAKWQPRDGLSVAGCTDATGSGDFRYGTPHQDTGVLC